MPYTPPGLWSFLPFVAFLPAIATLPLLRVTAYCREHSRGNRAIRTENHFNRTRRSP